MRWEYLNLTRRAELRPEQRDGASASERRGRSP
jgi:hypothetical protein